MRAPGHGSRLVARLSSDAHHPMQGHVQILRFVLSAPHPPSDHFVLNAPRHPLDRDATFRPHPRALILAPLARAETSSATHLWGAIGTGAHRVGNQKLKTNLYTLSIPCKLKVSGRITTKPPTTYPQFPTYRTLLLLRREPLSLPPGISWGGGGDPDQSEENRRIVVPERNHIA